MNKESETNWLWVPPEAPPVIDPPVTTRIQELPLNKLTWPDFQRLCARLAQREGDVEYAQEYGVPGQKQGGIDIYIRRRMSAKYAVWQCKRYQKVTASVIVAAVDEFFKGEWVSKCDEFALCISCSTETKRLADEIEKQSKRLAKHGITIKPLGLTQLSIRLKAHPDLVDDFFGWEWVRPFCGEDATSKLGQRKLRPSEVNEFRRLLRQCYLQHFETVDPGLPCLTGVLSRGPAPFALMDRFVLPDILESRKRTDVVLDGTGVDPGRQIQQVFRGQELSSVPGSERPTPTRAVTTSQQIRRAALTWLAEEQHSVLIGDPGAGKSAFLCYVGLDLLSDQPRQRDLAIKWGHLLPVWVPFAMWVRMVGESETECSLADVLLGWLKKVCALPGLQHLVEQALDDSRLLLLVDGMDEWTNETAAQTTVALLEQFVANRSIPAIVTCRPLGFQRLGGLSSRWRRGYLAGMTRSQQTELARRWFLHQQRALAADHGGAEIDLDRYADNQARMLTEDIQRDSQLARLAETPLLLSGMIALSAQHVQLPRSRFRAYEQLTDLLLQEHPRRREKAAHLRQPVIPLSSDMRQRALACLAYETHCAPGSISLGRDIARSILRDFFTEALCKPLSEANALADSMIAVGADSVGILVEKAQDEIGFIHRTFQEFLAACHLRRMPFARQREHRERFAIQSSWQNVFLCLCYLNERTDENDQLVEDIETLAVPPEAQAVRVALLSELAFAGPHCSPATATRLANNAFHEIEHGSWMPLRRRVLDFALNGFHSDFLHSSVAARISTWYPNRHDYRSGAFQALADWPQENATTEAFFRALRDEEEWTQRAAAEALPKYAAGDSAIRDRLLDMIAQPCEPRGLAYALHSLCLGWPQHAKVAPLLEEARRSGDITVATVATYHRVQREESDQDDRSFLLSLGDRHSDSRYHWRDDAAQALAKGWPDDTEIKELALQTLKDRFAHRHQLNSDFASTYLFSAYPQDDEVAAVIALIFRTEKYPSHSFGFNARWVPLIHSFGGHPLLHAAVDDWFEKHGTTLDHDVCLVSHTDRAKKALLTLSNKPGMWGTAPIRTLVAGWGVEDEEVRDILTSLCSNSDVAPYVADLLPSVLSDNDECRRILLAHLREQPEYAAHIAFVGLLSMGCKEDDTEVVEAALHHWGNVVPSGMALAGVRSLIRGFAKHPRVRELALHQIRNKGGDIASVSAAYRSDADMRAHLLATLTPLPSVLRLGIVEWLERQALDDDYARDQLAQFDEDTGQEVKTAAAVAYARSVQARNAGVELLLDKLRELSRAVGPDYEDRREAAFAALLEIHHAEIAAEGIELFDKEKPLSIQLGRILHPNMRLARQVAEHWEHIQQTFGGTFWDRTDWIPDEVMEEIASSTSDSKLRDEIHGRLFGRDNEREPSVAALNLFAEQMKGTVELRDRCLPLVRDFIPNAYVDTAPCIRAAEILGQQFTSDTAVRKVLEAQIDAAPNPSAAVIALCEGWPDSEALDRVDPTADRERRLLLPARVALMAALRPPAEFLQRLGWGLPTLTGTLWDFLPLCARAIQRRFEVDEIVRNLAFSRLESDPTPAEKMTFSSMLHRTDSRIDRLRALCSSELSRQQSCDLLSDMALDITTGVVRPVAHVLLEILSPIE